MARLATLYEPLAVRDEKRRMKSNHTPRDQLSRSPWPARADHDVPGWALGVWSGSDYGWTASRSCRTLPDLPETSGPEASRSCLAPHHGLVI